jgi:hypothetical protein
MEAADSPVPGEPGLEQLAAITRPFVDHPKALGMHGTIYDPGFDLQREYGKRIVELLQDVLATRSMGARE